MLYADHGEVYDASITSTSVLAGPIIGDIFKGAKYTRYAAKYDNLSVLFDNAIELPNLVKTIDGAPAGRTFARTADGMSHEMLFKDAEKLIAKTDNIADDIVHKATKSLVRRNLPDLPTTFAREFDGPVRFRTFKAGQKVYRSPSALDKVPSSLGIWFGTRKTATQVGTDSMYQIVKYNNPNKVVRTYEFTQDVTVYYGKVKGGTGYQILVPKDINTSDILKFKDEAALK